MAEAETDPRILWIEARVCGLLRCKTELFQKLCASEEDGDKIRSFVNDKSTLQIFFYGGGKELTVASTIDSKQRKKVVYVQKVDGEADLKPNEVDKLHDLLIVGDLNGPVLESFNRMLRNVYYPIIANPRQGAGLSEVASKALADDYQKTLAALVVAIGQTKGKTLLPLPPSTGDSSASKGAMASGERDRQDKDRVHVLETAVVQWTERINTALSKNPESVFANGEHPGPLVGVQFWQAKMDDLGDILSQLHGPQITKVRH